MKSTMQTFNVVSAASCKFATLAFATTLACILFAPHAQAQATRTWVSGVGDDANPGSRTAPCKTFAGAISKTATGGEISVLDPGGFGAVTIVKSITLDGEGTLGSILASGTNGIVINAGASGVVSIRNISLNGNGNGLVGIKIISAAEVNIESCVIAKFPTHGIQIECAAPCRVNVRDTIVRDCLGGAVMAKPNTILTATNCSLLASQFGLRLEGGATATLDDCMINGHAGNGVVVDTSVLAGPAIVNLNRSVLTDNGFAGVLNKGAASTTRLSGNTITGNVRGIGSDPGSAIVSSGNNNISGNTTDGVPTSTIILK